MALTGLFLLLASIVGAAPAQAQVFDRTPNQAAKASSFGTIVEGPDLAAPTRTEAADVDGDGDPDVIAYSGATKELAWFENQSDGFGAKQVIDSGGEVDVMHTADLTQNGRADVLISGDAGLRWYRNNVTTSGADADGFGEALTIDSEAGLSDDEVIVISFRTRVWFSNQRVESGTISLPHHWGGVWRRPLVPEPNRHVRCGRRRIWRGPGDLPSWLRGRLRG